MAALIVMMISVVMVFGVFPMTLMIYATIRDKRNGYQPSPVAEPDKEESHEKRSGQ